MWLTNLSIRRPIVILMLFATLLVLGLKSRSGMPVDLYPKIDIPNVIIMTVYPGAGPEEIETLVSKPIEDAVGSVSGMKNITSTSQEGLSIVSIEFELGTNLDDAAADIRSKVDSARMSLPQDVKSPVIQKIDIGSMPVLYLGMSSKRPVRELRELADDVIKDRLGKLKGVAAVTITGGEQREIQVNVDKSRLEAYGLSINQISRALTAGNLNLPSGRITEGAREYAVRAVGEFTRVDEIRDLKIKFSGEDGGRVITIGDIAEVKDSSAEREETTRLQMEDSIGVLVQKQSDANTVEVADAVKKELEAMKDVLPKDVEIAVAVDQSDQVREALADVNTALILGAFLAVLIVFLFLHNIRGTFMVAIAIPTSIVAAFIPIYFAGFTMNMMVMLAFALAVGILVDDSIVVLENIYRHLARGEDPRDAALKGRSEIGLAAITITVVDVVVFVPIAFMGGIVGQFFRQFGITVAVATLFSLLVSFTLTPMLASRWYRKGDAIEATGGLFAKFDRFYRGLDIRYRGVLAWSLGHRRLVVMTGFGLLFVILFAMGGPGLVVRILAKPWKAAVLGFAFALVTLLAFVGSRTAFTWARDHRRNAVAAGLGLILVVLCATIWREIIAKPLRDPWGAAGLAFVLLLMVIYGVVRFRELSVWARDHKNLAAALGFVLLLIVSPMIMPSLGFEFFPRMDQGQVMITVEMPTGTSLAATDAVVSQVEDALEDIPEMESVFTNVGSTRGGVMGGGTTGANYGQIIGALHEKESVMDRLLRPVLRGRRKRTRSDQEIAAEVREKVAGIPGGRIMVKVPTGHGPGGKPIDIELTGSDTRELNAVAQQIKSVLASAEGILNPDVTWKVGKPEVKATIDRVRAADMGFSVEQIASALRTSVEGSTDTHFREGGKEYDIRVRLNEFDRHSLSAVGRMVIGSVEERPVFLQDVARISRETGPTKIERKNRQRKVSVTADLAAGYPAGNIEGVLSKPIAAVPLGNVQLYWAGESERMREEGRYIFAALLLSIALVYMLMAALFESLLTPLIIMFSLPMALIGAILGLAITGETLSIVAMIGIIMLMGLVTKNAILLVDYTNTLRGRGMERNAAILEAGPTRLRPILMTTFAMIGGMLPTALKLGRGSEMRAPMAIAVIGGLIVSTLLTLVVIPVLYTIFDDLMARYQRRKEAFLGRFTSPGA